MKKTISLIIGNNIKLLRVAAGLSQQELAERMGVRFQDVSRHERGMSEPRGDILQKYAEALGTTPAQLRGEIAAETGPDYIPGEPERELSDREQAILDMMRKYPVRMDMMEAYFKLPQSRQMIWFGEILDEIEKKEASR